MSLRLFQHGVAMNNNRCGARRIASWRDDGLMFTRMTFACDDATYEGTCSHHMIVLTLSGTSAATTSRTALTTYHGRDRPGALSFTPADMERRCSYGAPDLSFAGLWVLPAIADRLSDRPLAFGDAAVTNGRDEPAATLIRWLSDEVTAAEAPGALFAEHIAALALLRLAKATPPARGGALCARVLRAVEEHVDAHLADDLTVADLAAAAGMPLDTFARHFRARVGTSPYAYVVERRLDRAERLLRDDDASIAAIAARCGFSSQSHLTSAFRRRRGTTPARWRANFRPGS